MNNSLINLRPTLIIGLGGTGCRIALELKARLEDEFGEKQYSKAVKFLFFDTAKEDFTAYRPNHPDLPPVKMIWGREFISISDVPLYDLMHSSNPAIAKILPEILHSTQIDQGAQQVRRLGRVALFYHSAPVLRKLEDAINELRGLGTENDSNSFKIVDTKRLRVYILCSVCGGTGSGTFIDMAYWTRYVAREKGLEPRAIDVIGMLMMPEVFPEVGTTGSQRLRANAYAALLDLEYYNQAANATKELYEVILPPNRPIKIQGAPFSLCYLVSGNSPEGNAGNMDSLAPILAESIYTQIATSMGEKLDATLDNVKSSLSTYLGGYRAFYSAIGISQILYPKTWLNQRLVNELMKLVLREFILRTPDSANVTAEVDNLFAAVSTGIEYDLRSGITNTEQVLQPLTYLEQELDTRSNFAIELQVKYRDVMRAFQQGIVGQIQLNINKAVNSTETLLTTKIKDHVNDPQKGLIWTDKWLEKLENKINDELGDASSRITGNTTPESVLNTYISQINEHLNIPVIGSYLAVGAAKKACRLLSSYVTNDLINKCISDHRQDVLWQLIRLVHTQRQEVSQSILAWQRCLDEIDIYGYGSVTDIPKPIRTAQFAVTQEQMDKTLNQSLQEKQKRLENLIFELVHEFSPTLKLAACLGVDSRQMQRLTEILETVCQREVRNEAEIDVVQTLIREEMDSERNSKLGKLNQWAQPLLSYRPGTLQNFPPRQIKVLGMMASEEARDTIQRDMGDMTDVSIVQNHDRNKMTYITTHHGIPISALANIEDYRSIYHSLSESDRNAIFHIDRDLEDMPYDPGSMYFFNLDTFEVLFARAVAMQWINRWKDVYLIPKAAPGYEMEINYKGYDVYRNYVYGVSVSFYESIRQIIDEELRLRQNSRERVLTQLDNVNTSAYQKTQLEEEKRRIEGEIESLKNSQNAFIPIISEVRKSIEGYAFSLYKQVWTGSEFRQTHSYALLLTDAFDALLGSIDANAAKGMTSRLMPNIFQSAFNRFSKPSDTVMRASISSLTEEGRPDYELSLRLQNLWHIYKRLQDRQKNETRNELYSYIYDDLGTK